MKDKSRANIQGAHRSENRMAEEGKLKEVDTKKEKDVEDGKQ